MAIYHFEAKIVSRGTGRSVVAASAYASCSKLYNDYDGLTHDYTRKRGCQYREVFLPDNAPVEWQSREALWNAVEDAEKARDSRLARELIVALPAELSLSDWQQILQDFIREQCTAQGMCADVSIHDTDGHNPHAHILLTVRPLDEKGRWQAKTQKEYLCRRGAEERGFTAEEFLAAKKDGWEKQYPYKFGKNKLYFTPSEAAENPKYTRTSKSPKSTRYGRQNPVCAAWNSEEQLLSWRQAWEDVTNLALEKAEMTERVNCRSHATRGLAEQPTIHEGYHARNMEAAGLVSERCALNRQIQADNKLLRELKSMITALTEKVQTSIPAIAAALEGLRDFLISIQFRLFLNSGKKRSYIQKRENLLPVFTKYQQVKNQINHKTAERKNLRQLQKDTSILNIPKQLQLSQQITTLTEEIEELKTEKSLLLKQLGLAKDSDAARIIKQLQEIGSDIEQLDTQRENLLQEKSDRLTDFDEIKTQIAPGNRDAVWEERYQLREENRPKLIDQLQDTFGQYYSRNLYQDAANRIDEELFEPITWQEEKSVLKKMQLLKAEQQPTHQKKQKHRTSDLSR